MAQKVHTAGSFKVEGTAVGTVVDITTTINLGMGDTTPIGTSWETAVELAKNWEMSISCNYDPADTAIAALITAYTSGDAALSSIGAYEDVSGFHGGSALLTNAVVTKSVGSPDKFTASFKGNGALTHTT